MHAGERQVEVEYRPPEHHIAAHAFANVEIEGALENP
jgi:hypothetical protein